MKSNLIFPILCIFLLPLISHADNKNFMLTLELSLKGKSMGPEKISLKAGEKKFTIRKTAEGQQIFLEAEAEEKMLSGKRAIRMIFTVGEITASGVKTVLEHFHIIANENQEANIAVKEDKSSVEKLSLKVAAKEIAP